MSDIKKHIKKDRVKWVIVFSAIVLIIIAIAALFVGFCKTQPVRTITSADYSICAIDETTGEVVESDKSITMKDVKNIDGLKIVLKEDSNVKYKVAFFDESKTFISVSDEMNVSFDNSAIPETAKYFKITITPNQVDGEDVIIDLSNVSTYANQLTVSFNK